MDIKSNGKSTANKISDVRIAYICLCHFDPWFIAKAADALRYKNDGFFVHVDKRTDVSEFIEECADLDNVHFVSDEQRVCSCWGGFNAVIAAVRTMQLALSSGDYDRFMFLQGQDYPLVSNKRIHGFFTEHQGEEFCRAKNLTESNSEEKKNITGYWIYDIEKKNPFKSAAAHYLHSASYKGIINRKPYFESKSGRWDIYKGWAQLAITRECAEYLVNAFETDHRFNRYMKHRFPADELYFQTLIYNSEFRNRLSDYRVYNFYGKPIDMNLTYFKFQPEVLVYRDSADYQKLKSTNCLFARKLNSESKELIAAIDAEIREE